MRSVSFSVTAFLPGFPSKRFVPGEQKDDCSKGTVIAQLFYSLYLSDTSTLAPCVASSMYFFSKQLMLESSQQKQNPEGVQLRRAPNILLISFRYPLPLLTGVSVRIMVSTWWVYLSLLEMVPRTKKVQNPLSWASRVPPARVSKLCAGWWDGMGITCVLHPGACGHPEVHLAGELWVCEDGAVDAARWDLVVPCCPDLLQYQKCRVLSFNSLVA